MPSPPKGDPHPCSPLLQAGPCSPGGRVCHSHPKRKKGHQGQSHEWILWPARGPWGCHHCHLRSWQPWVSCLALEALERGKSWVGVPGCCQKGTAGDPDPAVLVQGHHPQLSVPKNTLGDSPGSGDPGVGCRGGDKEECHSPEAPSSLVARGDQGHPGEKEKLFGGVLGWLPPPKTWRAPEPHPQPWLPVLAIQSFQASRALWGQGDSAMGRFALGSSGGARGTCSGHPREWEQIPGNGEKSLGVGKTSLGMGTGPRRWEQPVAPPGAPKGDTQTGSYLDSRGSRGPGGSWHPRGASHALAALQSHRRSQGWAPEPATARGTGGDTTEPLPGGTHCPCHSPSQPQALVALLDQPFLGNQGDPKGERGVE